MDKSLMKYLLPIAFVITVFALALLLPFFGIFKQNDTWRAPTEKALKAKFVRDQQSAELIDPNQAPEDMRDLVKLGYHIMIETSQYAAAYVGDRVSCTNCHFAAGNTTGGRNAGISLVGVAATYPSYSERFKTVMDLPARINNCFENSMNGKPLPLNSREMLAIVCYLHWISRGTPIYDKVSWLGMPKLESKHIGDAESGKKVYAKYCAMCHGKHGFGEVDIRIPPLWGPKSFNEGAGMNREETMASFVYYNMPYDEPQTLTEEEALDVAAFIGQQLRPKGKSR